MESSIKPISPAFIGKLICMLTPENENLIQWNNNGDGFIIKDIRKFIRKLMPQFFKTRKLSSFIRQLNFYGFHKVINKSKSSNLAEFKHPLFKREKVISGCFEHSKIEEIKEIQPKNDIQNILRENQELKTMLLQKDSLYMELASKFNELKHSSPKTILPYGLTPLCTSPVLQMPSFLEDFPLE